MAPLPRQVDRATPTTGFDDVRTVALARLVLDDGAQHPGGLDPVWAQAGAGGARLSAPTISMPCRRWTTSALGPRRVAVEEVRRNITAAGHDAGRARRPVGGDGAMSARVRVSAVSFLNARPLVHGLDRQPDLFDRRLRPAVDLRRPAARRRGRSGADSRHRVPGRRLPFRARHRDRLRRTDALGGGVHHRGRSSGCGAWPLDTSSRTSAALCRILCARLWGIAPEFVPAAPELAEMLGVADAALVIGDPALRIDPAAHGVEKIDLGEAWRTLTGLPFVYAAWTGRPGVLGPRHLAALAAARDAGLAARDAIAAEAADGDPALAAALAAYLRDNLTLHVRRSRSRRPRALLRAGRRTWGAPRAPRPLGSTHDTESRRPRRPDPGRRPAVAATRRCTSTATRRRCGSGGMADARPPAQASRRRGHLHHRPQRQLHQRLRRPLQLLRVLPHRRPRRRLRPRLRRDLPQDRRDLGRSAATSCCCRAATIPTCRSPGTRICSAASRRATRTSSCTRCRRPRSCTSRGPRSCRSRRCCSG